MGRFDEQIGARRDEVGANFADLQAQIDGSKEEIAVITATTVDVPVVDNTFTPIFTPAKKNKVKVTLRFANFGTGRDIKVVFLPRASVLNATDYDNARFSGRCVEAPFSDDVIALQLVTTAVDVLLEPNTQYDIIRLVSIGSDGDDRAVNPTPDPVYAPAGTDPGYPSNVLYTFTTSTTFTAPLSKPHLGSIIENNLDDTTTRQFDAWVSVQIIAPASASAAAAGLVSTTVNSTTVTGNGSAAFLTDFPVGSAIEVNGETHIVTARASNASMTVDYPFKTANTNQAATKKTLYTFDSAGIVAVVPKFRGVTDSEVKAISPHFAIDEVGGVLTNVRVKVLGFAAAKQYNYVNALAIGEGDARLSSTPSTTQTFTAGNFTTPTANIPEWTTAPFFQYDATDPQNDNRRDVSLRITETSPPIAKDKIELYRRNAGTGTISGSTTTITGVGTAFLTDLAPGHFIIAAGQTLEVASRSSDTVLILVTAPSPSLPGGTTWTKSVLKFEQTLQIGKFHPSAGGLIPPIKFGEIKTKKLGSFDFVAVIYALNGVTRTITDSFTTGGAGEVANDTAAPSGLDTPVLAWTAEGRLKVTNLQASTNIKTLKQKYIVLHNGSGTYYNFLTNAAAANEAAARFPIGLTGHVPLLSAKLKKLRSVFGTGSPTNVFVYWYAENEWQTGTPSLNLSSASSNSNAVDLTSIYDHQGDRDTIRGLDVESTLTSPGNILGNGDWILVNVDEQYNWARWDGVTTPLPAIGTGTGSGAYRTVRLTSTEISYVDSAHSGWIKANTTYQLLQNVKQRFLPGETYAFTMFLRADTAITVTIKLHLYNLERPVLTGTADLTSTTSVHAPGGLFTTEVHVGDLIVISGQKRTVATIIDDDDLTVTSAFSAASGAMNIIIDNINDTISQSLSLTTSNQLFGAIFSMKQSPNLAATAGGTGYTPHQFGIEFTGNTDDIYVDKQMAIRGEQPMLYAPRGDEVDSLATAAINPTYIAAPDIVTISGTPGGWLEVDSAAFITIQSV